MHTPTHRLVLLLFYATQDLCSHRFDSQVEGPEGPLAQFISEGKQSIVFFLDEWLHDQERSSGFMYRVGDGKFVASTFLGPNSSVRNHFWQVLWCLCLVTAGFVASCSQPDVHIMLVCKAGKHRSLCMASAMHVCFRMLSKMAASMWDMPVLCNMRGLQFTLHWDAVQRIFSECSALRDKKIKSVSHMKAVFRRPNFITKRVAQRLAAWTARAGSAANVLFFTISDIVIRPLLPQSGFAWQAVVQACAALVREQMHGPELLLHELKDLDVAGDARDEIQLAGIMQCIYDFWPDKCSVEDFNDVVFPFEKLWCRIQNQSLIQRAAGDEAATSSSSKWGDEPEADLALEGTPAASGKRVRLGNVEEIAVNRLVDVVVLQVGRGVLLSFCEDQRPLQSLEAMPFIAPASPGFQRHALDVQKEASVRLAVCQGMKDECATLQRELGGAVPGWEAMLPQVCTWRQCQALLFFHMLSVMSLDPASWFTVSAGFLNMIADHVVENGMVCPLSLMHRYILYLYLSRGLQDHDWFKKFPGFLERSCADAQEQWKQIHDLFLHAAEAGIKVTGFQ
jgi:hypothetical protein